MTTLCLCDWVDSDEHHAWRAKSKAPTTACREDLSALLLRDRLADRIENGRTACFAILSNPTIQEYVS